MQLSMQGGMEDAGKRSSNGVSHGMWGKGLRKGTLGQMIYLSYSAKDEA